MDTALYFFRDGGLYHHAIAFVWIIGLVIALERLGFIVRVSVGNRRVWSKIQPMLEAGRFREASHVVSKSDTALAHIMSFGLKRIETAGRRGDIEKALQESLVEVIPRLEKRAHYVSSLANIVMLMGLLGLIVGLIGVWVAVAQENPAEKASLLAASISVAMNSTALGLVTAITLLLAHLYLETKATEIVDSLEIASVKLLDTLNERSLERESPLDRVRSSEWPVEASVR